MMTDDEKKVLRMTSELWAALLALPEMHPLDNQEHMRDIHDIQNRLLCRVAQRANPELFP